MYVFPVSWPAGNSANSLCKGFVDEHATIDKSGIGRIHAACEIGFKIVVEEIDAPLPHNPFVLDQLVAFTQLCRRECACELRRCAGREGESWNVVAIKI